ncbi:MAG: C39 family peptidase [Aggregatilineales bacterium]|jgi:hypothetical protein|nr:C39 family peptidase [Aggregatilineales bacterium]HPV07593.1 C39 family peptidase [Aggregatilineales bacterium]
MNHNNLPQTETYYNTRKKRRQGIGTQNLNQPLGWLPGLAMAASVVVLIMAITAPLWLPRTIRRIIPDRYIIAYAPEPLAEIILDIDPSRTLPTPDPFQQPAAIGMAEATPWPTLAAITPPETTPTDQPGVGAAAAEAQPTEVEPTPAATATPTATAIPDEVLLTGMRHVPQGYNKCGPATMTSYLSFYGSAVTQDDVSNVIKPHPEDSNVRPDELADYARSQGFGAILRINGTLDVLKKFIAAGIPVMIERGFDELPDEGWMGHYMLMIGYSEVTGEFTAMDSYWGTNRRHDDPNFPVDKWEYNRFDALWQDFNRTYIVVYTPDREAEVLSIIGEDIDDTTMYVNALNRTLAEQAQNPDDPFVWFNLGEIYNALGDYQQAAAAFDRARQIGTPWRTLWYRFGPYEAYYQTGRYDDVMALARATTDPSNYPESEEGLYYMGKVFEARGDTRNARAMYQRALQYNHNYAAAQQALAALGDG